MGFDIQWGTALYQLAIFIILLLLLKKFALGPLMGIMEERSRKIENDLQTAENHRNEAEKLLSEQRAALEAARKDASQILENARVTSERQAAETVKAAKEEVENLKRLAQEEIISEKQKAVEELRAQVGSLAVMLATKVIEKELDAAQQEKLISEYLKEVGKKQ